MKKAIKYILFFLNILAALSLILSYVATVINPSTFWLPSLFGLAYPYFLLTNILFILIWLMLKPMYSILSIGVILIGFANIKNYFQLSGDKSETTGIEFMSYNIKNYMEVPGSYSEKRANLVNFLNEKESNIICLQEANLSKMSYNDFKRKFNGDKLPKYGCAIGSHVLMSDYPIIQTKLHKFKKTNNQVSIADLKLPEGDTIRIFNCHLQSYYFSRTDISALDSINTEQKAIEQAKVYAKKLRDGFIKRSEQVAELDSMIAKSPYQHIICGDFNDTPVSYTYHSIMNDELTDAFVESGDGIGNTYIGKLPSFRIDYILHSDKFRAANYNTEDVELSDHYPIRCTLITN